MLAFLRDHNDSQSVIDIFERLYFELRPDRFCTLFKVCLADNGTEFSSPKAVEYDRQGNLRTRIFPYDAFSFLYEQEILLLPWHHKAPPRDVTLNRSIFHREDSHKSG